MKPFILFRGPASALDWQGMRQDVIVERNAIAASGLACGEHRTDNRIASESRLVIGRYSVLPYYRELEIEILAQGSALVNTYAQHRFVADLGEWYPVLEHLTPKTWRSDQLAFLPLEGPFVVKGETNGRKDRWNTHMFARDKREAIDVVCRLGEDSLVSQQSMYVRRYVPLVDLGVAIGGCPIAYEFRFFCLFGGIMAAGFYWSSHVDAVGRQPVPVAAHTFVEEEVLPVLEGRVSFVVVDVALTKAGHWMVVELNDGQMSGLSECDPFELYRNMAEVLGT